MQAVTLLDGMIPWSLSHISVSHDVKRIENDADSTRGGEGFEVNDGMAWPLRAFCSQNDNGGSPLVRRSPASDQCNERQNWVEQSSLANFRLPLRTE